MSREADMGNATDFGMEEEQETMLKDSLYEDPSLLSQFLKQRAGNPYHSPSHAPPTGNSETRLSQQSPTSKAHSPPKSPRDKPTARRAAASTKHVIPRLAQANTAPTTGNPLQHPPLKMFQSFQPGYDDAPGDTQPDSQIYRNFTSGIYSHDTGNGTSQGPLHAINQEPPTDQTDLPPDSQHVGPEDPTSPTTYNDDVGAFIATQYRVDQNPTSPVKFLPPETPALGGKRRSNEGEVVSSAVKTTPGTNLRTAFFGNGFTGDGGQDLNLSQMWHATQAGTSPAPNALRSDPVFQRPSPNFAHPRPSSPLPATSSPSKLMREPSRDATDTQLTFTTSEETQELRERQKQAEQELQQARDKDKRKDDEDDGFDEPTSQERRFAARRAREQRERQSSPLYASVKAPSREAESRTGGRKKPVMLISEDPAYSSPVRSYRTSRRGASQQEIVTDDDTSEGSNDEEDSPDELALLATTSHQKGKKDSGVLVPNTSSRPERMSGIPHTQTSPAGSPKAIRTARSPREIRVSQVTASGSQRLRPSQSRSKLIRSTQTSAIADSQPDVLPESDSLPPPPRIPHDSSLNSVHADRVPQSQLNTPKSRKAQGPSSIPPLPPSTSQYVPEEEERMPSSPPLLFHEHSEGEPDEEERESGDGQLITEDMGLVEDHAAQGSDEEEEILDEEENLVRSSQFEPDKDTKDDDTRMTKRVPRKRRSTIPESENVTQESAEPSAAKKQSGVNLASHVADTAQTGSNAAHAQSNSTEAFQTAPSHLTASPQKKVSTQSSRGSGIAQSPQVMRLRKLTDIANLPETQESQGDEVDMPNIDIMGGDYEDFDRIMSGSSPVHPTKKRKITYSAKALRSPAEQIIRTPSVTPSPSKRVTKLSTKTPPSARRREDAGAFAAAQARETAVFTKPAVLKAGKLARPTPRKKQPDEEQTKGVTKRSSTRTRSGVARASEVAETPQTKSTDPSTASSNPNLGGGPDESADQGEIAEADQPTTVSSTDSAGESGTYDTSPGQVTLHNRVFARWPQKLEFYPAICVGRSDESRLKILWVGTGEQITEAVAVRRLELHIGDVVKVNIDGMRKNLYVVVGFKNKISPPDEGELLTDVHGYQTVVLELKPSDNQASSKGSKERVDVAIQALYLTTTLWKQMKDRPYVHQANVTGASRPQTPSVAPSAPDTPKSRSRRPTSLAVGTSMHRATSVASSVQSTGILANMAFALTSTSNAKLDRDAISSVITNNGGRLVDPGFEIFFEDGNGDDSSDEDSLTLKSEYASLGFVALVTDGHSRSTKYLQALALNIPCLHFRWIRDSIASNSALPFAKYLLPAGTSYYLYNTVRSRNLTPYDPTAEEAAFSEVLRRRERLLASKNVVLVTGKAKRFEERKKPYLFLIRALGVRQIERCSDLTSARDQLASKEWDCVYVDGGEKGVEEAEEVLFDVPNGTKRRQSGIAAKGKKRKRDEEERNEEGFKSSEVRVGVVNGRRVRIVGDEFVVQSLILGALVEE